MAELEPDSTPITTGELIRTLQGFRADAQEQFREIRAQVAGLNYVHVDVYAADKHTDAERRKAQNARIDNLEDSRKWLYRTVGGAFIGLLLTQIGGIIFLAAHGKGF